MRPIEIEVTSGPIRRELPLTERYFPLVSSWLFRFHARTLVVACSVRCGFRSALCFEYQALPRLGMNFSATPLLHQRSPVGLGPSPKM